MIASIISHYQPTYVDFLRLREEVSLRRHSR